MSAAHLCHLVAMATPRIADKRLPLYVRRHWSHMATGWIHRARIAERTAALSKHPEIPDSSYYDIIIPGRLMT
ncbi:MAG: hypothetical protein ACYDBH_01695 [Acidobacteriaceae bacterium]